jgi:type I restriction enzyme S subunit
MDRIVNSLESFCIKITDGAHNSPLNVENGIYPMYSVKDMNYFGFNNFDYKTISLSDYNKLVRQDCRPLQDDILIAKDGSYLKYVFRVKEPMNAVILSSIAILRPNKEKINPIYLSFLLRNPSIKSAMSNFVSGSALPRIVLKDFKKIKLQIFSSLSYQNKVSSILEKYDLLIQNNLKQIEKLQEMGEQIYKEWFVRFRFLGHQENDHKNRISLDWETMTLEKFGIKLSSGSRPKGGIDPLLEDGIPSLGAENINELGEYDFDNTKFIPEQFYSKLSAGKNKKSNILIYKDGAYIGKTTLFRDNFPFEKYSINEHVFFLEPLNQKYENFIYLTLHQKHYFELMQILNRNAAQPGLSKKDIGWIKLNFPNEAIIRNFNKIIDPIFSKVYKLSFLNYNLKKQRDMLLPRLFSGKLQVKQGG